MGLRLCEIRHMDGTEDYCPYVRPLHKGGICTIFEENIQRLVSDKHTYEYVCCDECPGCENVMLVVHDYDYASPWEKRYRVFWERLCK
jgi:hypothetical protein